MPWNRYIIGYHGCHRDLSHAVISRQADLHISTNDYDWLGHGIYFWEYSPERALEWARITGVSHPAVIGAVVDLGQCLNLTEAKNLDLVAHAYKRLQQVMRALSKKLPKNSGRDWKARNLDCAVFEALHQSRFANGEPEFDTVRAFFVEGKPLYENAGIRALDHVQVCVRNPGMIIGYFHPINLPHA